MATGGQDWLLVGHALVVIGRPVTVWLLHSGVPFVSAWQNRVHASHILYHTNCRSVACSKLDLHTPQRETQGMLFPCAVSFSLSKLSCLRGIYFIEKCFLKCIFSKTALCMSVGNDLSMGFFST